MSGLPHQKKKSLLQLLGELPTLVRELIEGEIELLKAEVIGKLKAAGLGAGLLLGAAIVALLFVGVLLTAAILALSLVMPGWLAALLVALVLLIAVAILAWLGIRSLKSAMPPVPEKSITNLQLDLNAIRGVGKRETP